MRITILGHASVLVETENAKVLVDPLFDDTFASDTLQMSVRRRFSDDLLEGLTAVVVTHAHLDHFHPPTLAQLPRDVVLFTPPDPFLVAAFECMKFTQVEFVPNWARRRVADLDLLFTPSDFEAPEFGVSFSDGESHYWHMSDAIVTPTVAETLLERVGRADLVACKYQPIRTVIGHQRGLSSTCLDKDEVAESIEAACLLQPRAVFPYFFGFGYAVPHRWADRHLGPFSEAEVCAWVRRKLGAEVHTTGVRPGDVYTLEGDEVCFEAGTSPVVAAVEAQPKQPWEPIESATLLPGEWTLEDCRTRIDTLMVQQVHPWIAGHLAAKTGLFDIFADLGVIWQCQVHLGDDERYPFSVDFRHHARLELGHVHPQANLFSHLAGYALERIVDHGDGAELLWMAGGYRQYEKVLTFDGDTLTPPALSDWQLLDRLPDPLVFYLRKIGLRRPAEWEGGRNAVAG